MPQPQINNHFFKSISSWDDFVSSLLPLSKKEKGDAFELLTKYSKRCYYKINETFGIVYNNCLFF